MTVQALVSHGPSLLLKEYCTALKPAIWASAAAQPSTGFREAEALVAVAEDLLDTAARLQARAAEAYQERLPLSPTPERRPRNEHVGAFKQRFPEISEERTGEVIVAYELITRLCPYLILFPELLYVEIRVQLALGVVGLDRALALIEIDRHLKASCHASP